MDEQALVERTVPRGLGLSILPFIDLVCTSVIIHTSRARDGKESILVLVPSPLPVHIDRLCVVGAMYSSYFSEVITVFSSCVVDLTPAVCTSVCRIASMLFRLLWSVATPTVTFRRGMWQVTRG